ncbi:universal stress protein [Actinoplanes solisilvae]|uniref:universal stress protein n=1 Tax=Actinoplanes solisilvae TaxID=2486853 RepID=UPI000FD7FE92|nr:universal stress protein [Actinoplanes solisilvae]
MNTPIVVGIDGSERGLTAVRVAADEAARRHRGLRIVHALIWVPAGMEMDPAAVPPVHRSYWNRAEGFVTEALKAVGKRAPCVEVTAEVIPGSAAKILVAESRRAPLLVIGDRGLGNVADLMLGSVALQTATHGSCPVLVTRGTPRETGPVVVGVDGSAVSADALLFAAEEASNRGAELVAMNAWHGWHGTELNADLPTDFGTRTGEDEQRRVLAEAVAGIATKYPDLTVRQQVINGSPRFYLTAWSRTAQLVVVGGRGHGGFAGLLLGSVGQHLLHHSECPVAVARSA